MLALEVDRRDWEVFAVAAEARLDPLDLPPELDVELDAELAVELVLLELGLAALTGLAGLAGLAGCAAAAVLTDLTALAEGPALLTAFTGLVDAECPADLSAVRGLAFG